MMSEHNVGDLLMNHEGEKELGMIFKIDARGYGIEWYRREKEKRLFAYYENDVELYKETLKAYLERTQTW